MNQEDYPSDSDGSDEDFRPDKEAADTGSELESNDEEPEDSCEQALDKSSASNAGKKRKRKSIAVGGKRTNGANKRTKAQEKAEQTDEENSDEVGEEEEKRRTDALWADFLGGSSSNSTSNTKQSNSSTSARNSKAKDVVKSTVTEIKSAATSKAIEKEKPTVAQLFEFAGEQIVLTKDDSSDTKQEKAAALSTVSKTLTPTNVEPRGGGGLGSVLNQISKKNKLSTLEKTKLDWTSFKRQEGIEEELQTHNKGKEGFLERRDFLERTDLRQFEIEKSFRQTKRSNR